jgi:hypothetical protein
MSDWIANLLSSHGAPGLDGLFWRIGLAVVFGAMVAGLYRWARRGENASVTFVTTLILISTLISMATQIIGDNVARAFSMVGALSVVRFRTVVKDTQDTAFVIFAVVVGMAAGANQLPVALVGLIILSFVSLLLWPRKSQQGWRGIEAKLSLRVAASGDMKATCESVLALAALRVDLVGVSTARQGAALDLTYRLRMKPDASPAGLVTELNRLEGVENVDLRRDE